MILLELPSIPGDSLVEGYNNWIACQSVSWSITREMVESAKAGTKDLFTGVSDLPPIEMGKSFDKSSPLLMKLAAGGGAVGGTARTGRIHLLTSGSGGDMIEDPRKQCYLQFTLDDPVIASWSISGEEDGRPTETLTVWYWKVYLLYKQFDGKTWSSAFEAGWDRKTHKPWTGVTWNDK